MRYLPPILLIITIIASLLVFYLGWREDSIIIMLFSVLFLVLSTGVVIGFGK